VFENRVLKRMFGPKRDYMTIGWNKLHDELVWTHMLEEKSFASAGDRNRSAGCPFFSQTFLVIL
jgi:hypothetical protein